MSLEEFYTHFPSEQLLAAVDHGLNVAHDRVEVESFVEHIAVHVGKVILPELLLFGEHEFLKLFVGGNGDQGSRGLESYAPLETQYGIAQVDPASDAMLRPDASKRRHELQRPERHPVK